MSFNNFEAAGKTLLLISGVHLTPAYPTVPLDSNATHFVVCYKFVITVRHKELGLGMG